MDKENIPEEKELPDENQITVEQGEDNMTILVEGIDYRPPLKRIRLNGNKKPDILPRHMATPLDAVPVVYASSVNPTSLASNPEVSITLCTSEIIVPDESTVPPTSDDVSISLCYTTDSIEEKTSISLGSPCVPDSSRDEILISRCSTSPKNTNTSKTCPDITPSLSIQNLPSVSHSKASPTKIPLSPNIITIKPAAGPEVQSCVPFTETDEYHYMMELQRRFDREEREKESKGRKEKERKEKESCRKEEEREEQLQEDDLYYNSDTDSAVSVRVQISDIDYTKYLTQDISPEYPMDEDMPLIVSLDEIELEVNAPRKSVWDRLGPRVEEQFENEEEPFENEEEPFENEEEPFENLPQQEVANLPEEQEIANLPQQQELVAPRKSVFDRLELVAPRKSVFDRLGPIKDLDHCEDQFEDAVEERVQNWPLLQEYAYLWQQQQEEIRQQQEEIRQEEEEEEKSVMLNGYGGLVDTHNVHSPDDSSPNTEGVSPVATLCNLGNTCFLNSVLYTLRFAPNFLHNLHHTAVDLMEYNSRYSQLKSKSSSLGRGIGGGSKSWSNKDLSAMGQGTQQEDKIAVATLRLHELYESMHNAELKDRIESIQPEIFLVALREVNTIFEGNQQHDAHELLVCLLDNIRETCRQLSQLSERQRCIIPPTTAPPSCPLPPTKSSFSSVRKSLKLGKKSNGAMDKKNVSSDAPLILEQPIAQNEDDGPRVGYNFISEDFQGITQVTITCLECEYKSEKTEPFTDICVPITSPSGNSDENVSSLYHSAIVTEEYLQDTNKYFCENCGRHNEARRCVRYEALPRLLILQLKRFSSSFGSVVQKVNDFMPTPMVLSCFCIKCKDLEENRKMHRGYQLYGVIMHLGSSMASGHYVAYVCSRDTATDCAACTRDKRKTASLSGGAGKQAANPVVEKHGLLRFFSKSSKVAFPGHCALDGGVGGAMRGPYFPPCRSADCCGVKLGGDSQEPMWLECDDDNVRTMSRRQFEELLANRGSKGSCLTPYLLFYSRIQ